jgi:hypothetical protein
MTLGGAALTSVEKNSRPQLMSQRTSCTLICAGKLDEVYGKVG